MENPENISMSLDELVAYAIGLGNEAQAEVIAKMCLLTFCDRMTPEIATKIARIYQHYKGKKEEAGGNTFNAPVGQVVQMVRKIED